MDQMENAEMLKKIYCHVQPVSCRLVMYSFCIVFARRPLDGVGGLVKPDSSFFYFKHVSEFACCRPIRSQVNVLPVPSSVLLSRVCVFCLILVCFACVNLDPLGAPSV